MVVKVYNFSVNEIQILPAWVNIINYIQTVEKITDPNDVWDGIDRHLKKYNATFNYQDEIEFASEGDVTMFLLRWS